MPDTSNDSVNTVVENHPRSESSMTVRLSKQPSLDDVAAEEESGSSDLLIQEATYELCDPSPQEMIDVSSTYEISEIVNIAPTVPNSITIKSEEVTVSNNITIVSGDNFIEEDGEIGDNDDESRGGKRSVDESGEPQEYSMNGIPILTNQKMEISINLLKWNFE